MMQATIGRPGSARPASARPASARPGTATGSKKSSSVDWSFVDGDAEAISNRILTDLKELAPALSKFTLRIHSLLIDTPNTINPQQLILKCNLLPLPGNPAVVRPVKTPTSAQEINFGGKTVVLGIYICHFNAIQSYYASFLFQCDVLGLSEANLRSRSFKAGDFPRLCFHLFYPRYFSSTSPLIYALMNISFASESELLGFAELYLPGALRMSGEVLQVRPAPLSLPVHSFYGADNLVYHID